MAGTRKLEKFELDALDVAKALPNTESGTQKMLELVAPAFEVAREELAIRTPRAEMSPLLVEQSRPSFTPEEVSAAKAPAPRAADREPGVEKLRTRLARKFTTLADEVTEDFDEFRIGAGAWCVELTAPEGMSTGGGKRSMQHLRLKPKRPGHAVLVGGVVNAVAQEAELRDYDHMQTLFRARFARDLEITEGEWEQFLRKAEVVLQKAKIQTYRAPAPRELVAAASKADNGLRQRKIATIAFAVIAVLALFVAWRVIEAVL